MTSAKPEVDHVRKHLGDSQRPLRSVRVTTLRCCLEGLLPLAAWALGAHVRVGVILA